MGEFAIINGRNELIVHLELMTAEMQKQSNRQWKISIGIMVSTLAVGIAAIIIAIFG